MIQKIKQALYFPIASYFRFFALIRLTFWKPKVIVITGSNGKTTLLHLLESQLGDMAKYSHHANSAFGIPFNILGLGRKTLTIFEWPILFLFAPIKAFNSTPKEKLYIVEADCDRPFEGKFLASLLNPSITVWFSVSKTHTVNFPTPVLENVAKEFGNFLAYTKDEAIVNGDAKLIEDQLPRTKAKVIKVTKKNLREYQIHNDSTAFKINSITFKFNYLLPEDTAYLLGATSELLKELQVKLDPKFPGLILPPGRSTILKGIKNTTIIDSSYNATPASVKAILKMYKKYPAEKKWLVIGDMIELGTEEQIEHEILAAEIADINLAKVILIGPRVGKYTYPKLKSLTKTPIETFINPKEALDYLEKNLKGKEVILFKGARFLEGIIEHLLANRNDIEKLCRREQAWKERRKKWGL